VFRKQVYELSVHGFAFGRRTLLNRLSGAVPEVIEKKRFAYASQGFADGRDLDEDVGAVALFLDHFLQATDLTFDSFEALEIGGSNIRIDGYRFTRGGRFPLVPLTLRRGHSSTIPLGRMRPGQPEDRAAGLQRR